MSRVLLRAVTLPNFTFLPDEPHPSMIGKPPGYRGFHEPAEVMRTADVEGMPLPLYAMSNGRHPWPALADIRRLLDGFSCRIIEAGTGLHRLTMGNGLLDVVSPIATAAAVNLALKAGRITPVRAEAILKAIGEHHE